MHLIKEEQQHSCGHGPSARADRGFLGGIFWVVRVVVKSVERNVNDHQYFDQQISFENKKMLIFELATWIFGCKIRLLPGEHV